MGRAIDVSKFQGTIDYDALPADIDTILMQAAYGLTGVDPDFARNWSETLRTGRTPVPYFYAYPEDAVDYGGAHAQAVHFYNTVTAVAGPLYAGVLAPRLALDLEEAKGSVQWAIEFLSQLINLDGLTPYFYSYLSYINTTLSGGVGLAKYSLLWLADTGIGAGPPPCPKGWPEVTLWQNNQHGTEPGIDGPVDEDVEVTPVPTPSVEVPEVDTATFVRLLYACLVFRVPTDENLAEWSTYVETHGQAESFIAFSAEPEAVAKRAKIANLLTS
jgi:GH25 family lysozyme M1 (1,4-beta-N-acetylmuramidase)